MNIPGITRHDHFQSFLVSQAVLEKMLHAIRSPLGAIIGLSDIISATATTPEEKKIADILKSSSEDLKIQIDTLFDTLQPESGSDKN